MVRYNAGPPSLKSGDFSWKLQCAKEELDGKCTFFSQRIMFNLGRFEEEGISSQIPATNVQDLPSPNLWDQISIGETSQYDHGNGRSACVVISCEAAVHLLDSPGVLPNTIEIDKIIRDGVFEYERSRREARRVEHFEMSDAQGLERYKASLRFHKHKTFDIESNARVSRKLFTKLLEENVGKVVVAINQMKSWCIHIVDEQCVFYMDSHPRRELHESLKKGFAIQFGSHIKAAEFLLRACPYTEGNYIMNLLEYTAVESNKIGFTNRDKTGTLLSDSTPSSASTHATCYDMAEDLMSRASSHWPSYESTGFGGIDKINQHSCISLLLEGHEKITKRHAVELKNGNKCAMKQCGWTVEGKCGVCFARFCSRCLVFSVHLSKVKKGVCKFVETKLKSAPINKICYECASYALENTRMHDAEPINIHLNICATSIREERKIAALQQQEGKEEQIEREICFLENQFVEFLFPKALPETTDAYGAAGLSLSYIEKRLQFDESEIRRDASKRMINFLQGLIKSHSSSPSI